MNRNKITEINDGFITVIDEYLNQKNITDISVNDTVFARDNLSVSVLTRIASEREIDGLLANNKLRYEDMDSINTLNDDGTGRIGITTYIVIDSGNNSSTQKSLSENSWMHLLLKNYLRKTKLSDNIITYSIDEDTPKNHPFSSQNTSSIFTIIAVVSC